MNLMDSGLFKKFVMLEDHDKSNALYDAYYSVAFNELWTAVQSKLEAEDQKDILFSQNIFNLNFLMNAIFNRKKNHDQLFLKSILSVIQSFLSIIKKLFNYEEQRKFLFTEGLEGLSHSTALDIAVEFGDLEVFTILWTFIKHVLSRNDQKEMWLRNREGNIFIRSFNRDFPLKSITKHVISASKEILSPEEIRKALTEKDNFNLSVVALATIFGAVNHIFDPEDFEWVENEYMNYVLAGSFKLNGNDELNSIVQELRDALKDDLGSEELKAVLYTKVKDGGKALNFALFFGSSFLADRIFQLAHTKLNRSERLELIQTRSPYGFSILTQSLWNVRVRGEMLVSDSVCNFLVRQSDLVSDVKALVLLQDSFDNYNFFSLAAMQNKRCLLVILNWFKENVIHDDLRKVFFNSVDPKSLAQNVAEKCDESLTKKFFEFCLASLDPYDVKDMILIRHYDGLNALGRTLLNKISTVFREVWNFYVQIFTEAELEEMFFKSNQGSVYFKKMTNKNTEAEETLKAILIERYGEDKIRKLIRLNF